MSDCAIPTNPVDTKIVAADAYKHYQDVVGATSSPSDASVIGQRILCAYEQAYWMIYNCVSAWGVADSDITDLYWQTISAVDVNGPLRTMLRWCAAYYWLTDSGVSRSDPVFQNAARYHADCQRMCEQGMVLTKPNGTKIDLSATAGTAGQFQGEVSYRENTAGAQNDWRMQSTPLQFLPGKASTRVAGAKYGNKWDGST
ncbi:MAG TPA: hypothetical protein VFH61_02670 [Thermoleophilia bacterium]|nr:hypothetical protein [Thermoleophilia bacterium]